MISDDEISNFHLKTSCKNLHYLVINPGIQGYFNQLENSFVPSLQISNFTNTHHFVGSKLKITRPLNRH